MEKEKIINIFGAVARGGIEIIADVVTDSIKKSVKGKFEGIELESVNDDDEIYKGGMLRGFQRKPR